MAVDFSNTLIVAISASALFDLSESERQFQQLHKKDPKNALQKFHDYMVANENTPLTAGVGYPLIKALLKLNGFEDNGKDYHDESPLVEVVIVSKSSPDTGVQVLNSLRSHGLNITRSAFISGEPVAKYIADFKVDLFLTTNRDDAQAVTDASVCACALLDATPVNVFELGSEQLRIAFDGDAVLFDGAGELMYQQQGLKAFHDYEDKMSDSPMEKGPYADFLIKLSKLQQRLPITQDKHPVQIALVTARNAPADLRAIKTLRAWGVTVDMAFFLGGLDKTHVLRTFAPHIFFDDSIKHIERAKGFVPTGLVPYRSDSGLNVVHQLATSGKLGRKFSKTNRNPSQKQPNKK